jgi:hypothetical protein
MLRPRTVEAGPGVDGARVTGLLRGCTTLAHVPRVPSTVHRESLVILLDFHYS